MSRSKPAPSAPSTTVRCPDSGDCHHRCVDRCFRVDHAPPLPAVFLGDEWPADLDPAPRPIPTDG